MTARNVWPWECLQVHNPAKLAFFATLGVREWLESQIHNSWSIHSHHQQSLVLEPAKWNVHNIYIIYWIPLGTPTKGVSCPQWVTMMVGAWFRMINKVNVSSFAPCNSPSFHDEDVEEAVPSIWTSVNVHMTNQRKSHCVSPLRYLSNLSRFWLRRIDGFDMVLLCFTVLISGLEIS